jgi:hypothetical protein
MDRLSQWLFYSSLVALAVLLFRLVLNRLFKTYRFLFGYFAAVLAGGLVIARIPYRSTAYGWAFMIAELVIHILAILTVLEVYRIALVGHAGLAEFGRASILVATVLAVSVAAAISLADQNIPKGQSAAFHWFLTLQRSCDLILVVFLVLIALFITWFPVEMSKNTALCIAGFSVVFFVRAGVILAANILPRTSLPVVNNAAMILETLITIAWATAVRPEEAREQVIPGHFWDPGDVDRLSHQLNSINATLARFVRH